jgi:hypothetical protein
MMNEALRWCAYRILVAEAKVDPERCIDLVELRWDSEQNDGDAVHVYSESGLFTPRVRDRLRTAFERSPIEVHEATKHAQSLGGERAAESLDLFLNARTVNPDSTWEFHGLAKTVEQAPVAFADVLLRWFVRVAEAETLESTKVKKGFSHSKSPPLDWNRRHGNGGLFELLKQAIALCAKDHRSSLLALCQRLISVEVEEVQALAAEMIAACGETGAEIGATFLLSDERRWELGRAYGMSADGIGRSVEGWSTQLLLGAIVPHLPRERISQLLDAIEAWEPYLESSWDEAPAELRLRRVKYAEQYRIPLLEKIPKESLSSRRCRQIQEWRAQQPQVNTAMPIARMLRSVDSPMTVKQMECASDDDLFRMLDQVPDGTVRYQRNDGRRREGGSDQLADAFANFSKVHPARGLAIVVHRLQPGRHETAAGAALSALAGESGADPVAVLSAVRSLDSRGFASDSWRSAAAAAMEAVAERCGGLSDEDVALLETWIVDDPSTIAERARLTAEARSVLHPERPNERRRLEAVVFHTGLGGEFPTLPQDNFAILSAMSAGLLCRPTPDDAGWLAALERHAQRTEDPAVWTAILANHADPLLESDQSRGCDLMRLLWTRFSEAFNEPGLAHFLWDHRRMFPIEISAEVISRWARGDTFRRRQAAGELLCAFVLVGQATAGMRATFDELIFERDPAFCAGCLFAAAAAWSEHDVVLRRVAHQHIMRFIHETESDVVDAIASAFDDRGSMVVDDLTEPLLEAVTANDALLKSCLDGGLIGRLQELMLYAGLERTILQLLERVVQLIVGGSTRYSGAHGDSLVALAIALQRAAPGIRAQAMDLYENLLDAAVYGAEEAANASLVRA